MTWAKVEAALPGAKALAYDGCHKIYVLLDDRQVAISRGYGYGEDGAELVETEGLSPLDTISILERWFEASCSLRFINAVHTVPEGANPNDGYIDLIGQFEEDD